MALKSLIRSTLLIGSSSMATTLVAILRVKALALMLGPAGLGLLGVLAGLASAGTTLAALGSDTSGTRRIALDRNDAAALARVRRVLALIAVVHGLLAAAVFWWLREPIATWALGSSAYADEVATVGIAVALSLTAGLQIAQLQGLARVGDIARINILASLGSTLVGLLAVWQWGMGGIIVLVLAQPAVAALLATHRMATTGGIGSGQFRDGLRVVIQDWGSAVAQGAPYMLSFLMLTLVPLAIRALLVRDLGFEAAGHFHAAWTMSVIYIGFLLNAMSADYFPRLTALVSDPKAASTLVNDQMQLGLAFGGVALLVILAGAPILVPLLYSSAFAPAVEIVELQAFGNLMKIAGWPIAFLAMARGRSMQFLLVELAWSSLLLGLVWIWLPHLGLTATGAAFAVACAAFLLMQTIAAYATYGFVLERRTLQMLASFAAASSVTLFAARHSMALQLVTGCGFAVLLGLTSVRAILARIEGDGRLVAKARSAFAAVGWPMPRSATAGPA
jgi:O-antigen/teichoic acid export membrane protein